MDKFEFRLGWWAYALVFFFWLAGIGILAIVLGPTSTLTHRSASWIGLAFLAIAFTSPGWLTTWSLISEKTCIYTDAGFSRFVGLKRLSFQWSEIRAVYPSNFQMVIQARGVKCRFALIMYENPRAVVEYALENVRRFSVSKE